MSIRRPHSIAIPLLLLALLALFSPSTLHAERTQQVMVKRVIDGDTFLVDRNLRIRVLGIDTPELGRNGLADDPYAAEAMRRTRDLIDGRSVTLVFDQQGMDDYGRILAYVKLIDGRDLGEILLDEGLAMTYVRSPNLSRVEEYLAREERSRQQGMGIWSLNGAAGRSLSHRDALAAVGGYRRVVGRVDTVSWVGRQAFLNFGRDYRTDFTVVIDRSDWRRHFQDAPDLTKSYQGKMIAVRGRIMRRNGPMIRISHPAQIEIILE
ncbi:MAG: thermonuclease family protein [Magnetococcales bacterium]|nr:thermonuclease family protein [Magnetococcales bacterium]